MSDHKHRHGGGHGHHAKHRPSHGGFIRRFQSHQEQVQEQVAELKVYKEALEKELAGVTERITELERGV